MSDIKGPRGELRATLHITRKATGKTETVEIVGHTDPEQHAAFVAAMKKNRTHDAAGSMTGPGAGVSNQEIDDDGNA